jgi:TPR repeat protein
MAFKSFEQAANVGFPLGHFNLAICYRDGIFVDKNIELFISHLEKIAEHDSRADCMLGFFLSLYLTC